MAEATQDDSNSTRSETRRVQTESQFRKCNACGETLFIKELQKALDVCKVCGYHFQISAHKRISVLLDPGTFNELFNDIEAEDPLQFKGRRSYLERIKEAQNKTGLKDAVVCGEGKIQDRDVVVAVMDFQFIGGSMGSVVGEKITRAIELATDTKRPVIIVCCSGGARMDEGAFSLMQMAKTSAALFRHDQAGLLCVTLLTHPTLAGVSASFAFLGDIIIAEPKAMIGFTGARVIEQTIKKKLPEGFQESEFLMEHGQIDMVVERKNLRDILAKAVLFTLPQEIPVERDPAEHEVKKLEPLIKPPQKKTVLNRAKKSAPNKKLTVKSKPVVKSKTKVAPKKSVPKKPVPKAASKKGAKKVASKK
ncbi:MAG: acetyl-CoA carboxylase, carboxyltransferase subunit beta [Planctomycetota bacterium]